MTLSIVTCRLLAKLDIKGFAHVNIVELFELFEEFGATGDTT